MEKPRPPRVRWALRLSFWVLVFGAAWLIARDEEALKRDIAVGPAAEDLRHDSYAGAQPDDLADIAEVLSVLETHPWICVEPDRAGTCSRIEHMAQTGPGAVTATTHAVTTRDGAEARVEGSVALQVTEAGLCAPATASFADVRVTGPDALADRIEGEMAFLAEVYDEAGDRLCASFTAPRYDASTGSYAATRHDALDSAFATTPLPVRFLAARPPLRPRPL